MATFLVTGGAGFIGANLAHRLVHVGHAVRVLDNLSSGSLANLSGILDNIVFINADIRDTSSVAKALVGVDFVLHHAAVASVQKSVEDPSGTTAVNVGGAVNVLEQAHKAGVRRVVFAASAAYYGLLPEPVKSEDLPPMPLSPYAVHKYTGEMLCRVFSNICSLETVSLRYFNIYGPRQDPKSDYAAVVPIFLSRMMRGQRPTIYGYGLQTRDFCYVDDAVTANLLAVTSPNVGKGEVINIGCGLSINLLDLISSINAVLGSDLQPIFKQARPGDVKHSCADISLAQRLLGYEPSVSLDEGLRRTVEFLGRGEGAGR